MYRILDNINSDEDIKGLNYEEMHELSEEIRTFLVEKVTKTGGHLASNLGVVEMTLALHRVFDLSSDRIIFDVGHQSYTHKILTGRKDKFDELRQPGGLSGFTLRSESEYDPFGAGHSSTAISAALGFAEADSIAGRDNYTVAVVGDGAFTGGMVHEALNNCRRGLHLIIVLNENEMSISENTGRFARLIAKTRVSKKYMQTKRNTVKILKRIPLIGNLLYRAVKKLKNAAKNALVKTNYFEQMGLRYIGPADGNDIEKTELLLRKAKDMHSVVIVHLKTKKGKGYAPAEESPTAYHSYYPDKREEKTFNARFGEILRDMAEKDDKICAVTAAMGLGTGLEGFSTEFKDRFFDVGIAEEHALTFSAGLACNGMKPYFAVYSTFLQRGYDNILHDIALQNLPVRICIDRAGLATSDGATHHGIFDVAFLSEIPNMTVYAPQTFGSLEAIMNDSANARGPVAIRYSNVAESEKIISAFYPSGDYENYGARVFDSAKGKDTAITIVTYGKIVDKALSAKEKLKSDGYDVQIILLEVLKPLDKAVSVIKEHLPKRGKIIFLEEGIKNGGIGMILLERLSSLGITYGREYDILAVDDNFAIPEASCSKDGNSKEEYYRCAHISEEDIISVAKSKAHTEK
ncbi:MAG: 1-deoxy-D-xylulose-5-phosphate synthase [Eubacteriales bacterium]|nr:1-deoxy-D-xylulose-5-phosphate synthase [Eubacteriales bacterium]